MKRKNFLFFNLIPTTVFMTIIGIFINLFLIFFGLLSVFTNPIYARCCFYFLIAIICFSISFISYRSKYFKILKIPSYKSFIISRNKLIVWIFWTSNIYMLICWVLMIFIGSYSWFFISFPNSPHENVLSYDDFTTYNTGLVLWIVHLSILFFGFLISGFIKFIFIYAHQKLNIRRKNIETSKMSIKNVYAQ